MLIRVNDVKFEVRMPDKRKRKALYHIVMLKKWYSPVERVHASGWLRMRILMRKTTFRPGRVNEVSLLV